MLKTKIVLILFVVLFRVTAKSEVVLVYTDVTSTNSTTHQFDSDTALFQFLKDEVYTHHTKGFYEYSLDTFYCLMDTCYAFYYKGIYYQQQSNFTTNSHRKKQNKKQAIVYPAEQQITVLENSGFPFAIVRVDSLKLNNNKLYATYSIDTGALITIDSIINDGTAKLHKSFIQNYIGIKIGKPYEERKISVIDKLLNKLPYTTLATPTQIRFRENKADVLLHLNKRKVNRFDFIIGFLPNNALAGKLFITGEARIHLQNAFKRGEELYFEWVRLRPNSQRLNIRFSYPYLLNTALGVSTNFALDKRDSSSLDVTIHAGLPYFIKTNNYIKGYYKYAQTIILQADTNFVKLNRKLPNNLDATYNLYGIELYYENLDYLFNPRKGYEFKLSSAVGVKKINRNNQILSIQSADNFNYQSLYDTAQLKSVKADLQWTANYYLSIKKRSVIKFGLNGAALINNNLFRNELYRIGGNKLLRGFDEESIFASFYWLHTFEYRFLLQRNSYFALFSDVAYVRTKFDNQIIQKIPFGFGAGINFESKIGIFGVSYALGHQKTQPLSFRNSKIHFGYVATF